MVPSFVMKPSIKDSGMPSSIRPSHMERATLGACSSSSSRLCGASAAVASSRGGDRGRGGPSSSALGSRGACRRWEAARHQAGPNSAPSSARRGAVACGPWEAVRKALRAAMGTPEACLAIIPLGLLAGRPRSLCELAPPVSRDSPDLVLRSPTSRDAEDGLGLISFASQWFMPMYRSAPRMPHIFCTFTFLKRWSQILSHPGPSDAISSLKSDSPYSCVATANTRAPEPTAIHPAVTFSDGFRYMPSAAPRGSDDAEKRP
mmetsp:Transcript_8895/g.22942  ORF Transcript_8895/g.22942 Transcript_8895/m.22942 type:complete len:261 (+) Transcript_8895:486-1268(+)